MTKKKFKKKLKKKLKELKQRLELLECDISLPLDKRDEVGECLALFPKEA